MDFSDATEKLVNIEGKLYMFDMKNNVLTPVIWEDDVGSNSASSSDFQSRRFRSETETSADIPNTQSEQSIPEREKKRWADNETRALLQLAIDEKEKFHNKTFVKKQLYVEMANGLKVKGFSFTPPQCENKLKALINKFKEVTDHNNISGNNRRDWGFLEKMQEFMGNKDNIFPKAKCSDFQSRGIQSETETSADIENARSEQSVPERENIWGFLEEMQECKGNKDIFPKAKCSDFQSRGFRGETETSADIQNARSEQSVPERENKRWADNETRALLQLAIDEKEKFHNKTIVKKQLYVEMANGLKVKGFSFTPLQCENKLKALTNKFKEVTDHNNKSGNNRRDWGFLEEMQEFMGNKDNIFRKAKCSSLSFSSPLSTPSCSSTERNYETAPRCSEGITETTKVKRQKLTPRGELLKWVQSYTKAEEQKEKERREILERYHRETMEILKSLTKPKID